MTTDDKTEKRREALKDFVKKNEKIVNDWIAKHAKGSPLPIVWSEKQETWVWLNRKNRRNSKTRHN